MRYSLPKCSRGLIEEPSPLKLSKMTPGPNTYNAYSQHIKWKKSSPKFGMPKASRDVHFSKYASQFSELVAKSLH